MQKLSYAISISRFVSNINVPHVLKVTREKRGSRIEAEILYFSPNFSMFLSTMQTLPFEGHHVGYQCKGLNQSNIVCENEVNLSTNDKVLTEKQNCNTNC